MAGGIRGFEDLEVWQLAKRLTVMAYKLTGSFPEREIFGLSNQIRRAATSVPGNIAEGFGRYHYTDRVRFFITARGSFSELKSHLLIAVELEFLDRGSLQPALDLGKTLGVKLNNLIAATRKSQRSHRRPTPGNELP